MAEIQNVDNTGAGEAVEQQDCSLVAGGHANGAVAGEELGRFSRSSNRFIIRSSNCAQS